MYTDLTDETLEQAVICLKTMLQFLQAAIPCLNVHSEGGTSDRENHTNDGRYLTIYPLNLYLFLFSHYYLLIPLTLKSDQSRKQSKRLKAGKTDFKPYFR